MHASDRHDDLPTGLHQRLAANSLSSVCGTERWSPGQSSVGGGIHFDQVAGVYVIPLDVAVTVELTGAGVVAHDPVLVSVPGRGNRNGISPVDRIGRAGDQDFRWTGRI